MIFKTKTEPKPVLGQSKQKTKFAFFPVGCNDGFIWLGWYVDTYRYDLCYTRDFGTHPLRCRNNMSNTITAFGKTLTLVTTTKQLQNIGWAEDACQAWPKWKSVYSHDLGNESIESGVSVTVDHYSGPDGWQVTVMDKHNTISGCEEDTLDEAIASCIDELNKRINNLTQMRNNL